MEPKQGASPKRSHVTLLVYREGPASVADFRLLFFLLWLSILVKYGLARECDRPLQKGSHVTGTLTEWSLI
jgi:hypothetical protein